MAYMERMPLIPLDIVYLRDVFECAIKTLSGFIVISELEPV